MGEGREGGREREEGGREGEREEGGRKGEVGREEGRREGGRREKERKKGGGREGEKEGYLFLCTCIILVCRFSERGILMTYDTKGIVRLLNPSHYGGLSWFPVLDTVKLVGSKSDHYFLIGMTHDPIEVR